MHELRRFLTNVMSAKRNLKEVYYTARSEKVKSDAKKLVVSSITIQKITEELLELWGRVRVARQILEDRKAELTLRGWSSGIPKRVGSYKDKAKKLSPDHLVRYYDVLSTYLENIATELTKWVEDIANLRELPKLPKD